jgi:hypothetical protein
VFRRSLALAAVAALVLVPGAMALRVHVRVEGKTQTIFGATQPTLTVKANALDALDAASIAGEFYYHVALSTFGPYVDQIGRYPAAGSSGWVFKVDGVSSAVAADQAKLKNGDTVLWYWATFGPSGGPPTLVLRHARGNCYAVSAQDDKGKLHAARGAALQVDGRTVSGRCVGRHHGLVRATAPGAIRSNALR